MTVNSFIEIYTTLIGWSFYNSAWSILLTTGVVFIPLAIMLIESFTRAHTSMEANAGSAASVRIMEIKLALTFTAIVLAAQPTISMVPNQIEYRHPACGNETYRPGETGTSLDTSLGIGQTQLLGGDEPIRVPIWWYGLAQLVSGINHAMLADFPCLPDLRAYDQAVRSISIQDRDLRREFDRFANECFVPAVTAYNALNQSGQADPATRQTIGALLDEHGQDDPQWLGSRVFRSVPGFYDEFRAQRPVPGYAFDPVRDTEYVEGSEPDFGRPTCLEWWEGGTGVPSSGGLQSRLLNEVGFWDRQSAWGRLREEEGWLNGRWAQFWNDENAVAKYALRLLMESGPPSISTDYGSNAAGLQAAASGAGIGATGSIATAAATGVSLTTVGIVAVGATAGAGIAVASEVAGYYTMMWVVRALADQVQAFLLMMIYGLLPFLLVFGSYRWSAIFAATIGIFTIKFWSVLWMLAWWLDQNLWMAMYPDPAILFGPGSIGPQRLLLDMLVKALYIGLPLVFSLLMAWAGIRGAEGIDNFSNRITSSAAGAGGTAAKGSSRGGR